MPTVRSGDDRLLCRMTNSHVARKGADNEELEDGSIKPGVGGRPSRHRHRVGAVGWVGKIHPQERSLKLFSPDVIQVSNAPSYTGNQEQYPKASDQQEVNGFWGQDEKKGPYQMTVHSIFASKYTQISPQVGSAGAQRSV